MLPADAVEALLPGAAGGVPVLAEGGSASAIRSRSRRSLSALVDGHG